MWDEHYSAEEYIYDKDLNKFLANALTKILKGKVLCVAEGENRNTVYLAEHDYDVVDVVTVASSNAGLEKPAN